MLSGEQNCPSAVQDVPLVTLWLSLPQVHRTVSPTNMFNVSGTNRNLSPTGPTATSKTWLPANRLPLCTFRPYWSKILIAAAPRFSAVVPALRWSPDSTGDKNATVSNIASQQVHCARSFDRLVNLIVCKRGDNPQHVSQMQEKSIRSIAWVVFVKCQSRCRVASPFVRESGRVFFKTAGA